MNSGLSYSSRNRKLKEYICIVCVHVCLYHETFNQQTLKGVKQSSSDLEKQLTSSESEQLSMQRKIEKLTTELQHMASIEINYTAYIMKALKCKTLGASVMYIVYI